MTERGVFECDICNIKIPLVEDRMEVGLCGSCAEIHKSENSVKKGENN